MKASRKIRIREQTMCNINKEEARLILSSFSRALDLLDCYDHDCLERPRGNSPTYRLSYEECMELISNMRFASDSELFGKEKDDSFRGSIGNIYQTFGGKELYPSLEEKAATLLYLVTKNHSFLDGNKRIAATVFLYFLHKNERLFKNGEKLISDAALAALTLMIANSRPEEKDQMISIVINCIII
ncbi:MAG: Fic family protein [Clostridia bacterium]|nr:Fic family protein [Clostridia bacterium]